MEKIIRKMRREKRTARFSVIVRLSLELKLLSQKTVVEGDSFLTCWDQSPWLAGKNGDYLKCSGFV